MFGEDDVTVVVVEYHDIIVVGNCLNVHGCTYRQKGTDLEVTINHTL